MNSSLDNFFLTKALITSLPVKFHASFDLEWSKLTLLFSDNVSDFRAINHYDANIKLAIHALTCSNNHYKKLEIKTLRVHHYLNLKSICKKVRSLEKRFILFVLSNNEETQIWLNSTNEKKKLNRHKNIISNISKQFQ